MLRRVDGRSLPEYALILALVGLAAIPATAVLSGSMGTYSITAMLVKPMRSSRCWTPARKVPRPPGFR